MGNLKFYVVSLLALVLSFAAVPALADDDEETTTYSYSNLSELLASFDGYTFDDSALGCYSVEDYTAEAVNSALTTAKALTEDSEESDITESYTTLSAILNAGFEINVPAEGSFLRISSYMLQYNGTGTYYLSSNVSESDANRADFITDGTGAETIFYYDGSLLSFAKGYYPTSYLSSNAGIVFDAIQTDDPVEVGFVQFVANDDNGGTAPGVYGVCFTPSSSGTFGYTYMLSCDANHYAQSMTTRYGGRWLGFYLEEVTTLPYTTNSAGYATIYSPVALTIPDGITVYTAEISDADELTYTLTEIEDLTVIPQETPVVVKGEASTTYSFTIVDDVEESTIESSMGGQIATALSTGVEYVIDDTAEELAFTLTTSDDELAGFTAYATAETSTDDDVDYAETTTFTINTTTGVLRRWDNDNTSANSSAGTYFAYWTSNDYLDSDTDPYLILYVATANNMTYDSDGNINAAAGSSGCDYTLLTASGYVITGYSFDYTLAGSSATTFTIDDTEYTPSSTTQSVSITDLSDQTVTAWTQSGNNLMALSNFTVTVAKRDDYKTHVNLFQTPVYRTVGTYWIPYRIPAIATAKNGDVIAVADYRYSGKDIGVYGNSSGRLDLHYSVLSDNGATWTDPATIPGAVGYSDSSSDYNGFGDPAIVADRESNKILLLCCTGNVSYTNGTRDSHQGIARFYAEYDETNGWVWSPDADEETDDISETIYSMFDESTVGTPASMFVGSGRIFQSSTCKVGDYYRIYCAVLYKDVNSVEKNYVLYSDDFGQTWSVLGGVDAPGVTSGANEPKVEELPDGSIVLSSRITGGRYYNIYTFTSTETGAGYWGTQATSNSSNSGVAAVSNSCNGELMILPVVDSDGNSTYLALQSVPFGSGRANVGIYYKELASLADDYADPSTLAGNWDGSYQMSYIGSAYSTMTLQADGNLGFLFEEEAYGSAAQYTIVYYNLSISEITGGQYSYDADAEKAEVFTTTLLDDEYSNYSSLSDGSYVGMIGNISDITTAYNAYTSDPSQTTYEAFHAAIVAAETIEIEEDKLYTLLNYYNSGYYMEYDMINKTLHARSDWDYNQMPELFRFVASDTEGEYYVQNVGTGLYIGQTSSGSVPTTDDKEYTYTVTSTTDGLSLVACTDPTNSARPYLHLQTSGYLVVCWGSTDASYWYIKPVEIDAEELLTVAKTSLSTLRKQDSDEYSALSTALTTYNNETTDDNLLALYTAVYTYQNAAAPQAGNFYRFKGNGSGYYILNGTTNGNVTMGKVATADITDENYINSIYYYDDNTYLANYANGYTIYQTSQRTLYTDNTPNTWTIAFSEYTWGAFTLYSNNSGSKWMYDNTSKIDRNGSQDTSTGYHRTDWHIEEVDYLPVTISSVGKATLYTPVALKIPDGVTAYTLTFDLTAGTAKKTQLSDVIPAATGVLLEHDETDATTYKFYISDETSDADQGELTGSVYTQEISDISTYNYYILYNGTNGVAFYAINSLTSPYLSGSKAYYVETVSTSSESPAYFGIDGTATGVTTLLTEADDTDEPYYDLQGRPTKDPSGGIYIKDGRKVYVK